MLRRGGLCHDNKFKKQSKIDFKNADIMQTKVYIDYTNKDVQINHITFLFCFFEGNSCKLVQQ